MLTRKRRALLALLLLIPAPTIGVLFGIVIYPNTPVGAVLFAASKVWLFGLPLVWIKFVDHAPLSLSPPKHGGFMVGLLSGVLVSVLILAVYAVLGDALIDKRFVADRLKAVGLGSPGRYVGGALYWILVNSVLEEYAWRWFCTTRCEELMPRRLAVVCSALFFTSHHIVALTVYLGSATVLLCALGILIGGLIWSAMYLRYRSIWPGYVSHAIVNVCIFAIGASIVL